MQRTEPWAGVLFSAVTLLLVALPVMTGLAVARVRSNWLWPAAVADAVLLLVLALAAWVVGSAS